MYSTHTLALSLLCPFAAVQIVNSTTLLDFGAQLFVPPDESTISWDESAATAADEEAHATLFESGSSSSKVDFIGELPAELALHIFRFLSFSDLAHACQTKYVVCVCVCVCVLCG
jgi:F-box-like